MSEALTCFSNLARRSIGLYRIVEVVSALRLTSWISASVIDDFSSTWPISMSSEMLESAGTGIPRKQGRTEWGRLRLCAHPMLRNP